MRLARVLMAAPVVYVVLVIFGVVASGGQLFISFSDVYISLIAYALGRMIARRERR